jgi:hypothetical protein
MNIDIETKRESMKPLLKNLDDAALNLDIHRTDEDDDLPHELPIGKLRRGGRRRPQEDRVGIITLTEVDGMLQWEEGTGVVSTTSRPLRRGRSAQLPSGEIVAQYKFEKLPPSEVGKFLERLDSKLTPKPGLRRLDQQAVLHSVSGRAGGDTKKRKTLLLIHGTFSNNDHLLEELKSTKDGREFLGLILNRYDDIFAFDHPTLSVGPVLNALDLARLFADFKNPIDVITHSRGGLVARWWLEAFGVGSDIERRVVFVGAPLAGTSLAAPPRLRAALGLITNVAGALSVAGGAASLAVPMLSVAVGLVKVVASIASLGEKAPLIDAAVAMIPGLAGQSRVGNSAELLRLRQRTNSSLPDYYAVRCNFEPEDAGWAFWKRFRKLNLADAGTDLVFDGENDLVVDTDSMTDLFDQEVLPSNKVCDFGTTGRVHHTNYFQQAETLEFIIKSLKIK